MSSDDLNLQHVNVKIFVDGQLQADLENFINIFHRLVADQAMNEMMIDVADYRHVPKGPGVVMVGLEADYGMDDKDGRFGLRYNRKAPLEGTNQQRLKQAFWAARNTCALLEDEIDGLKFSRTDFELFINDRALAPNTRETREKFQGELETFLRDELGQTDAQVDYESDPRKVVGAVIRTSQPVEAANA